MVRGKAESIVQLFRCRDLAVSFSPQCADIFGSQAVKQKNLQDK